MPTANFRFRCYQLLPYDYPHRCSKRGTTADHIYHHFGGSRRAEPQGGFMRIVQTTRRQLLTNAAFAGAACLGGLGAWGKSLAAEPPRSASEKTPEPASPPKFSRNCYAPRAL